MDQVWLGGLAVCCELKIMILVFSKLISTLLFSHHDSSSMASVCHALGRGAVRCRAVAGDVRWGGRGVCASDAVSARSAGSKYARTLGLVRHPVALSGLLLWWQSRAFGCCCVGER